MSGTNPAAGHASSSVLVGRESEMHALSTALDRAIAGHGGIVLLQGDAGIGKTRLAEELAARARQRGAEVLWGSCYEGAGAPAFWPWMQILRAYVSGRGLTAWPEDLWPSATVIAEIVPELRLRLPRVAAPPVLQPEQARFRLFDSLVVLLADATRRQPLVLILDDLHWADRASLLCIEFLARQMHGLRLLVLASARAAAGAGDSSLLQTVGELMRHPHAQRIALGGLQRSDIARLIALAAGRPAPETFVDAVAARSEGNPFFVGELVRLLVSRGDDLDAGVAMLAIPSGVRAVILRRLAQLSAPCRRLIAIAAVIGRRFSRSVLERVARMADIGAAFAPLLAEARAAGVLVESPGAVRRLAFAHALTRDTVYDEEAPERRTELHLRVASVLAALHGDRPDEHLAELAYHYAEAARGGHAIETAVAYAFRAAEQASRRHAHEHAVQHLERGLQVAPTGTAESARQRCELLLALRDAQMRAGAAQAARGASQQAAQLARGIADAELFARAALGSGWTFDIGVAGEERSALLEEALARLPAGDGAARAKVQARLAMALGSVRGALQRRDRLSADAAAMARRIGDPATLAFALHARQFTLWAPHATERRIPASRELLEVARTIDDAELELQSRQWLARDLLERGDLEAADREAAAHAAQASELRQPRYLWFDAMWKTMRTLLRGQLAASETLAGEALALAERAEPQNAALAYGGLMFWIRREQGRLGELVDGLVASAHGREFALGFRSGLAFVYAELGRREEARREFAADGGLWRHVWSDFGWLSLFVLSEVCAMLGDTDAAAELYGRLQPLGARNGVMGMGIVCLGSISRPLGILATVMRRWADAERHFGEALRMHERLQAPALLARTRYDLARMHLARGGERDATGALDLLRQTLATARALGMHGLVVQAEGVRDGIATPPAARPDVPPGLREARAGGPGRPLIGRARELALGERGLRQALAGRGSLLLLSGEPGIGKTRLAEELAAHAAAEGALALWGRCWETGGARAFWPWVQVVRAYAKSADQTVLRNAIGPAADRLRLIVPQLTDDGATAPPSAACSPDAKVARFDLFDAIGGFLTRAAGERPLLIVFDDLHAADLPSLRLLQFVAGNLRELRLLVVGTYRDAEMRRRSDAAGVIGELERTGCALPLRGLDAAELRQLLAATLGVEVRDDTVAALQRVADGNPFLLEQLARVLLAERRLDRLAHDLDATVLPARARELVQRRFDLLPAAGRGLLRIASLVGQEFSLRVLQEAAGLSEDEVLERLREAVDDELVLPVGSGALRYRFRHALLREALSEELSAADRLAIHRVIGEALERLFHDRLAPVLGPLAHHFVRAAPAGDWQRAVRYASAAGDQALAALAYEDAAAHFEAALDALDFAAAPEEEGRCDLLLRLGSCRRKAGDPGGARTVIARAADIARALGRSDLLGHAALGYAPWTSYGRTNDSGISLLEEALAAQPPGDSPLRAELLARLAHVLAARTGPLRGRLRELSDTAIATARRVGEHRTLARALNVARWVDYDPARVRERHAMTEEILAIAHRLHDRELAVLGEGWCLADCLERADAPTADAALRRHAALAAELKQPEHLWWNAVWLTMRAVMEGRAAEAEQLAARALAIGERVEPENAHLVSYAQLTQLMIDRGQLAEALAAFDAFLAERREVFAGDPAVVCRKAAYFAELGQLGHARTEFERLAADDFAALVPDLQYQVNLALLASACAALADARRAHVLYERLRPSTGYALVHGPALLCAGPSARYQGILAATMGRFRAAARHFEDAAAMSRRMGWAPLLVRTQCDAAAMQLQRGRSQRGAAAQLLEEARAGAQRLGMALMVRRADALLEQCADPCRSAASVQTSAGAGTANVWRREGEYWALAFGGATCRLRHSSGLLYLGELLRIPGREIHALDLVGLARPPLPAAPAGVAELEIGRPGDAAELLDAKARAAYRQRLHEIAAELEAAESAHDPGCSGRLHAEREAVEGELARAIGLGGRPRRAPAASERARLNVTRAIRSAIGRIDTVHPTLGRHLARRVRTGTFCVYLPDPQRPVAWTQAAGTAADG